MSLEKLKKKLANEITTIVRKLNLTDDILAQVIPPVLEVPKDSNNGDLSTNIAMRIGQITKSSPHKTAKKLMEAIKDKNGSVDIEIKGAGFINFFFKNNVFLNILKQIYSEGDDFGKMNVGKGKKILMEYVSANPTGPLTVAHGRQAAVGDSLANILKFAGYNVTREYYLNDEGRQIDLLGKSIQAKYLEACGKDMIFPENGYEGIYISDIANKIKNEFGNNCVDKELDFFSQYGVKEILDGIKDDLKRANVKFDNWFSQASLITDDKVNKTLAKLKEKGYIYDKEGAVWFKSTEFGDDKDRVIRKQDGSFTYLAPDIAYHNDKYLRKYDLLVNIWGPDHHGYIPRIKAVIQALGYEKTSLYIIIIQLAKLFKGGRQVRMSTRSGEFITFREVMDEVGVDAARFFMSMRRTNSHLDFDIELAKKQSSENPVYYIQYAHSRICSILQKAKENNIDKIDIDTIKLDLLNNPEEIKLAKMLNAFESTIKWSADNFEPYVIIPYLQQLANAFHKFYDRHRVVGDDYELTKSRLLLITCIRIVLANGLRLLGVSAPEKM